ncbi:UNVERIFIED_CONTAM: hypothetical protein Cloal_0241 [Acetivibrio alkalicellulosi]
MNKTSDETIIIENIFNNSGIAYFNDNLKPLLENIIKELYFSDREVVLLLKLCHIDRALFKFKQAKEKL